jgi:hypothetical protein
VLVSLPTSIVIVFSSSPTSKCSVTESQTDSLTWRTPGGVITSIAWLVSPGRGGCSSA